MMMDRVTEIPVAVLACTLADGSTVADRVGEAEACVKDLEDVACFRKVWETRGAIDVPIWRDLGRISDLTAIRWQKHISELLAFLDRRATQGLRVYSFAGRAFVLFCESSGSAFGVDLPPK
jgi:hypothetical protein